MKQQRMTDHAQVRIQQRGIHLDALEIVLRYGSFQRVKGGKTFYMDKQAHQRAERSAENDLYRRFADKLGFYVIVSDDDAILTVAHSYQERIYRRRKPHYNRRLP